jgi:ABC-type transport system substrate-binding protein
MLTAQYNVPGGYNTANYINQEIEDLWVQQTESTDPKVRAEAMAAALRIAAADAPYAPILWNQGAAAVRNEFVLDGFHAAWYVIQPWANWITRAPG